nr:class II glutamine amidotransferase [Psychrobacter sp. PraFG1]UTT87770.1 class II glutamine amidotransferase [Psychrobacter sp. PraFG1]
MNANTPTDIGFSFTGFHNRGGNTDHHSDGFGIAFLNRANVMHPTSLRHKVVAADCACFMMISQAMNPQWPT